MKRKNLSTAATFFGVLLLLAVVVQTHTKVSSRCTVEPIQLSEVRPEVEGFIREVRVRLNDSVQAGQELALLENPDLSREEARTRFDLARLGRELIILQSSGNAPEYQMKLREQDELNDKLKELERKVSHLTLKSPLQGRVATPHLEEKRGEYLQRGDVFCRIEAVDRVKIEIPFREYYVEDVKQGQDVLLKLDALPAETFEGKVHLVSPATRETVQALEGTYSKFVAIAIIENPEGRLIPGMQGDAKILAQKYSVTGRIFRELRRWIQSRIW